MIRKKAKFKSRGENKDKWKDKNLKSKTKGMRDKKIGTREMEKWEESGEEAYERKKSPGRSKINHVLWESRRKCWVA